MEIETPITVTSKVIEDDTGSNPPKTVSPSSSPLFRAPIVSRAQVAALLLKYDLFNAAVEQEDYENNFNTYYYAVNTRLCGRILQPYEELSNLLSKTEAKFFLKIPLTSSEKQEIYKSIDEEFVTLKGKKAVSL